MPRFVIQKHILSNGDIHFDIMFEWGDVLKTYQIKNIEDLLNGNQVDAINIQDHRLIYLDYEGEISNNRGFVKIFDKGEYSQEKFENHNKMEFKVKGNIISGTLSFLLTDKDSKLWKVIYKT